MFCREQVALLSEHVDEIRAKGAELVAIGLGKPKHLAWFIDDQEVSFPAYTDPERATYQALGLKHGLLPTFSPLSMPSAIRAMSAGHRQTRVMGDPLQQGGALIVRPGGDVLWSWVNDRGSNHAQPADILAALDLGAAA